VPCSRSVSRCREALPAAGDPRRRRRRGRGARRRPALRRAGRRRAGARPLPAIDLDAFSGIVVGGSPFCTSDPDEEKTPTQRRVERELSGLLDRVVERDTPFLGACYGVGTLGVHQGGVVDRTYGEPISAVPVTLTDAGRADPLLDGLPGTFAAFVGHKEALTVPPAHAVVLARSETCPVQVFRVGGNCYATQFHPELDLDGVVQRVVAYRDEGYFAPEEFEEVLAGLRRSRVEVAHRVLRNFVDTYRR
jgi:GMP synthase (glutamine-hydrolysing)